MSSRAIVSLGVWILVMVLIGTMTVGIALAFYVALTAFFALVVGGLALLSRRRADRREHEHLWGKGAGPGPYSAKTRSRDAAVRADRCGRCKSSTVAPGTTKSPDVTARTR